MILRLVFAPRTAVVAVVLLMAGIPVASASEGEVPNAKRGTTFWQALEHFEDLSGRRWGGEQLAGKVVLVDFWATWCAPCRAEIPTLRKAYRRFHERGFQILGIALDRGERRDIESWLRRQSVTWPQIHERRGFASPVAHQFGIESLPRSFLLDRSGRRIATDLRGEALLTVLSALFSEAREPSPSRRRSPDFRGFPLSRRWSSVLLTSWPPVPSRTTSSAS